MDLIERYNRELKGCKFGIDFNDIVYTLCDVVDNDRISVSWYLYGNNVKGYSNIDDVFENIELGYWEIDKTDLRKKKLKQLISNKSI